MSGKLKVAMLLPSIVRNNGPRLGECLKVTDLKLAHYFT